MLGPSRQNILQDFRNEVQLLCQLDHQHLVSLIGFCDEKDEKIMVYNYVSQGSLFDHLHGKRFDPLNWKQRLEICIGAARGLHYLHAGAKRAVIHRDIKTKNILLNDQFVSKIADFTMSKIGPFSLSKNPIRIELPPFDEIETETSRTRLYGTLGYVAPELFNDATLVTEKSDIYSFGVVLFEVLCGRKAIKFDATDDDDRHIISWVYEHVRNGTVYEIMDPKLKGKIAPSCLEKYMEICLSCVDFREHKRPALGEVEATLEVILEMQNRADSEMEWLNPNGDVRYDRGCQGVKCTRDALISIRGVTEPSRARTLLSSSLSSIRKLELEFEFKLDRISDFELPLDGISDSELELDSPLLRLDSPLLEFHYSSSSSSIKLD